MAGVGGYYVYLKLRKYGGTDIQVDTIPLRATSVAISVQKSIPTFNIPFSGLVRGESETVALDFGTATKTISIQGVILDTDLKRSHTQSGGSPETLRFTKHEIAQLIASYVDSTAAAGYQSLDELVVLIPSFVNESYQDRGKASDATITTNGTLEADIPFTFASRGDKNTLDNENVFFPVDFPTSSTSQGLKGFITSFSPSFEADTFEISFGLDFQIARTIP